MIEESGYILPNAVNADDAGKGTISKDKMVQAVGGYMKIQQIGAGGSQDIIEEWKLWNPQITSAQFDSLDYSSDDPLNIQIGLKYDWAELTKPEGDGKLWNMAEITN